MECPWPEITDNDALRELLEAGAPLANTFGTPLTGLSINNRHHPLAAGDIIQVFHNQGGTTYYLLYDEDPSKLVYSTTCLTIRPSFRFIGGQEYPQSDAKNDIESNGRILYWNGYLPFMPK